MTAAGTRLDGREALAFFAERGVGPPPVDEYTLVLFRQYDDRLEMQAIVDYRSNTVARLEWTNDSDEAPRWRIAGHELVVLPGGGTAEISPVPLDGLTTEAM